MSDSKRTGRRRWSVLVKFLTTTMQTSRNEKVRVAAAMRLSDILLAREQRETAELRAAARRIEAQPPAPAQEGQEDGLEAREQVSGLEAGEEKVDAESVWRQIAADLRTGKNDASA